MFIILLIKNQPPKKTRMTRENPYGAYTFGCFIYISPYFTICSWSSLLWWILIMKDNHKNSLFIVFYQKSSSYFRELFDIDIPGTHLCTIISNIWWFIVLYVNYIYLALNFFRLVPVLWKLNSRAYYLTFRLTVVLLK